MIRKKFKQEYDTEGVSAQLKKLLKDENIIDMQKCYLYTQLKTYKELYTNLEIKFKKLEIENLTLLEKCTKNNLDIKISNKENYQNNIEVDDSVNITENIKNMVNEYSNRMIDQYEDENISTSEIIKKLRSSLYEKDRKIVELENTAIKHQIISRSQNIKIITDGNIDEDELINLKTRVEYAKIEKERLIINSNNKIMESKIKYEEFMKKYNLLSDNYNNSLLKIEDLKNIIKIKDKKKNEKIDDLLIKINNLRNIIDNSLNQINLTHKSYQDLRKVFILTNKQNCNLTNKLRSYKIFESKKNIKTGEDFYDEEISNLLEVCDSLTENNKKLQCNNNELEQKVNNLEIEKLRLENTRDDSIKSTNLLHYVEDLSKQKKIISDLSQEIKSLIDDKNRLIRLNVDRIKVSDKYKDELRVKNIEYVCLERRNEDIEKMIIEVKSDIFNRLTSNNVIQEVKTSVICNLCNTNPKNVAITSCMHTFCEECVNMRIKLRDRKCPICGSSFHVSDVKRMYL